MTDNYQKIVENNLQRLYTATPPDLAARLSARCDGNVLIFDAFGEECRVAPTGIQLGGGPIPSVMGIIVSLYALTASRQALSIEPWRSFKEIPNSMPYWGAFTSHTEQVLAPHVAAIRDKADAICRIFAGAKMAGGDFAFALHPLPKIALCYLFYEAGEEFPATVSCLFSNNANLFLPVDGLADLGEYTSKKILEIVRG
ncbi:MAG: DUF3786 domain-containing protein [Desulfobulbaceae bacterium]|jgi:hypothetical protein|nr:DUF3786 domain-containing protein [Desulfobulbaceae bacterium]